MITGGVLVLFVFMFFGKQVSRLFGGRARPIKHGAKWYKDKGRPLPQRLTKSGRSIPRSAGKGSGSGSRKGYPKVGGGYIPYKRNKDGSIKKAAFVAGTVAAKRRMSQIRKLRTG